MLGLLPVLMVGGPHLPLLDIAGVNLFAFRAAILAATVFPAAIRFRIPAGGTRPAMLFWALGILWIGWAVGSAFWAVDMRTSARDATSLTFGFITAIALLNLGASSREGLKTLVIGWTFGSLLAALVAGWELATGTHLPSSFTAEQPDYALVLLAISTFGNPNNYGAFIVLVTPMLLYQLDHATGRSPRFALSVLLATNLGLAFLTTSRLALLGVIVLTFGYVGFGMDRKSRILPALVILSVIAGVAIQRFLESLPLVIEIITTVEQGAVLEGSNLIRLNLAAAALEMTVRTAGLGVGAGSYELLIASGYGGYFTGGIVNPHNWFLEVLSQYGILVFAAFCMLLAEFYHTAQRGMADRIPESKLLLTATVAYAIASLANSTYLVESSNWLYLSTLVALAVHVRRARVQEPSATTSA
jgi:hypothetical protein